MKYCSNYFFYSIFMITFVGAFTNILEGQRTRRIVDGTYASITDFPSIVSIRLNNIHFCGGTFVTKCHVLTAAHCVHQQDLNSMHVAAGSSDQNAFRFFSNIHKVDIYPNYIGAINSFLHDIAVITMEQCIIEDAALQVAGVYTKPLGDRVRGTVIGWGKLQYAAYSTAQFLHQIDTWTITNNQCLLSHPPTVVRPVQLCTINILGSGFCSGDSGGPLFVNGEVAGIVSMGVKCGAGIPDIYTRVFDYLPWLLGIIRSN